MFKTDMPMAHDTCEKIKNAENFCQLNWKGAKSSGGFLHDTGLTDISLSNVVYLIQHWCFLHEFWLKLCFYRGIH